MEDSPMIPKTAVISNIKCEETEKNLADFVEQEDRKLFSIFSFGFNFSVEIKKSLMLDKYI